MKNLLVTGGAGFIGSNFVHHALGKYADYRIVVFDKLTYAGRLENLKPAEGNPRFDFVRGDICDAEYSIVRTIPYDRPNTTMSAFEMCRKCAILASGDV